jgi:hypothetical protein
LLLFPFGGAAAVDSNSVVALHVTFFSKVKLEKVWFYCQHTCLFCLQNDHDDDDDDGITGN